MTTISGFLLVKKPIDLTSFDCIRKLKKILPKKTVIGHAGTLDPFASGLLIIAISRQATRKISSLMDETKEYNVTAKLGELTGTLDKTGAIIESKDCSFITKTMLESAAKELQPSYMQIPPGYSALKYNGKPLYWWIREKKMAQDEIEAIIKGKQREVSIFSCDILSYDYPFFTFKTKVSKGTYIRSLAQDIAVRIGGIATCYELERTRIGNFCVSNAMDLEKFCTTQDIIDNLITIENQDACS